MERIRDALDETVQLSVLDGRYNIYVDKVNGASRRWSWPPRSVGACLLMPPASAK